MCIRDSDVGDSVAVAQCVAQELGHAQLSINSDSYSRADMGFQAVCIGYMLCKKYGVDTQNFAINRIPEKLAGKEPKDIQMCIRDRYYPQRITALENRIEGLKQDVETAKQHPKPTDDRFVGMEVKGCLLYTSRCV